MDEQQPEAKRAKPSHPLLASVISGWKVSQGVCASLAQLMPGVRPVEYDTTRAAREGQVAILQGKRLAGGYIYAGDAYRATASHGQVEVFHFLQSIRASVPTFIANDAASAGQWEMLRVLHASGHHCSRSFMDLIAVRGEAQMLRQLVALGSPLPSQNIAHQEACREKWENVDMLQGIGVRVSSTFVDDLAVQRKLKLIRKLMEREIFCTSQGVNTLLHAKEWALAEELMIRHGVHCTYVGMNYLAEHKRWGLFEQMIELNVLPSSQGVDHLARHGRWDLVEMLTEMGVTCTSAGADEAQRRGHFEMVQYLASYGVQTATPPPTTVQPRISRAGQRRRRG